VARNKNNIRLGFAHSGRNCADSDFSHKLDVNSRRGVRVLEVVNELLEIFN
jgi:hypothetical protein